MSLDCGIVVGAIFEQYVPPEGDGLASPVSGQVNIYGSSFNSS